MSNDYPVSAETVRANGVRGVLATGGGVALLIVNALLNSPVVGIALAALGVIGLFSKDKSKMTTTILVGIAAVGVATLIPHLSGVVHFLVGGGALALLVLGGISLFKFFKGIKSRA